MDIKTFDTVIKNQLQQCESVLLVKAKEYATEDRLHNFNAGAALTNKTPKEVLGGFMLKHTVSIYDMINSKETFKLAQWDEKITDHINYLLMLSAVVLEEAEERVESNTGIN